MHYEINVSQNGRHLFATHERSCRSFEECKAVLTEIMQRFPKEEGFDVKIFRYDNTGQEINHRVILRPPGTRKV